MARKQLLKPSSQLANEAQRCFQQFLTMRWTTQCYSAFQNKTDGQPKFKPEI